MIRSFLFGLVVVAVMNGVACGVDNQVRDFLVYDVDSSTQQYRLMRSRIETLDNLREGRGSVAKLRGGGKANIENGNPETEQEWAEAIVVSGDSTPDIQVVMRDNGVAMPWDFHSAMMLTLYHHLEQASLFFDSLGVSPDVVGTMRVYYNMPITVNLWMLPLPLVTDNAAYISTIDAFVIPPQVILNDVPLYANRGVVVHEYSHAVFNRLVDADRRVPVYALESWDNLVVNERRSLDEGVADFFAAVAVSDPNFLAASISDAEELGIDRDVSVERLYDAALRASVQSDDLVDYDPYILGSVVASALWALRGSTDADTVTSAVVGALNRIKGIDERLTLTLFFDFVIEGLPADLQEAGCQLFAMRLDAVAGDLACVR